MLFDYQYKNACRICESSDFENVLSLESFPLGDQYLPVGAGAKITNLIPFGVNRCNNCAHFQTVAEVNKEHYRHCLTRPAAVNAALKKAYRQAIPKMIEISDINTSDLVLEIGSNDGSLLASFLARGFRCLGVDPALNLLPYSKSFGVLTLADFFSKNIAEKIVEEYGVAKLVIANSVIANIGDFDDFFSGVTNVLAHDGVLVIETNYVSDIVSNSLIETLVHEHLNYFSVSSLSVCLEKYGLDLFDVEHVSSKGGSLRCYIRKKGAKFQINEMITSLKNYEIESGIFQNSVWQLFSDSIKNARKFAIDYCERKSSRGIIGYGSSDGATTIIYQLGIGKYLSAIVDDDAFRHNLESPGFGIPVISNEKAFGGRSIDSTCFILAPRYSSQIFNNNYFARSLGVTFVKLWPRIEVM